MQSLRNPVAEQKAKKIYSLYDEAKNVRAIVKPYVRIVKYWGRRQKHTEKFGILFELTKKKREEHRTVLLAMRYDFCCS